MSEKEHNISIIISDNKVYPEPSTQSTINPCIKMTKEEMKNYTEQMEQLLQKNETDVSLCAEMVHFVYNQHIMFYTSARNKNSAPLWYPLNNAINDNLSIEIILRPKSICSQAECARTLMKGGCIDPYVKKIGKKFFPKEYEDQRERD